jgi:hypothetical protein
MIGRAVTKLVGHLIGRLVGSSDEVDKGPEGYLLLENGDKLILEDGSGNLLLEG